MACRPQHGRVGGGDGWRHGETNANREAVLGRKDHIAGTAWHRGVPRSFWGQESRTPTRFCLGRLAWRTGSAICPPINGEPQLVCNDFGNRIPYDDYLRAFSQIRPAAMADRGPEP